MDWVRIACGVLTDVVAPFLAIVSLIILVHEGGHYLAARLCRLPVTRFSLGFGPRLCGWRDRTGCEWVVAAVPLGGFVKVSFDQRLAPRAWVIAAGPFANVVLAALLLFVSALVGIRDAPPVVAAIYPGSPAETAGLAVGDRILAVNGRAVHTFGQLTRYTALHLDTPNAVDVDRGGARQTIVITPLVATVALDNGRQESMGLSGLVGGEASLIRSDLGTATRIAFLGTGELVADTVQGLLQLATGKRSLNSMMGVVGIADTTAAVAQTSGLLALLGFAALLSINIAVINALPLPVLDGGQLVVVALETLARRPLPGIHRTGNRLGLGLLLAVMLFATWNDVRFLV